MSKSKTCYFVPGSWWFPVQRKQRMVRFSVDILRGVNMGDVIPFALPKGMQHVPRLLILSDRAIRPDTVCAAYIYATERMTGMSNVFLSMLRSVDACVRCQLLPTPHSFDALRYLAESKNVRIVAIVCLMKRPPRQEIEALFPKSQIFFEDEAYLRAINQFTIASS